MGGKANVSLRFGSPKDDHGGEKFHLVVICTDSKGSTITKYSEPFMIVPYKLNIGPLETSLGQSGVAHPPGQFLWYKDEGGQRNTIVLCVTLTDKNGTIVTGKVVPLRIHLQYDDGSQVQNQDVMSARCKKVKRGEKRRDFPQIDETGRSILHLKLRDVSSKHNHKLFVVCVDPHVNRDESCRNICGASSIPVMVKSKRTGKMKDQKKNVKRSSTPVRGTSLSSTVSNKRAKKSSHVVDVHDPFSPISLPDEPARLLDPEIGKGAKQTMKRPTVRSVESVAIKNLCTWAESTHTILNELQYGLVGYEISSNGKLDHRSEIKRCPSCWKYNKKGGPRRNRTNNKEDESGHKNGCAIGVLLSLYDSHVKDALQHLRGTTATESQSRVGGVGIDIDHDLVLNIDDSNKSRDVLSLEVLDRFNSSDANT